MLPRLDHFLTFAKVPNIDDYVERYRELGFVVTEETRPYQPGLRNRFIQLGCEYLELVWVENEALFAQGGTEEFARMFPDLAALQQAARPFSVALKTKSVAALHRQWTTQGYHLPPVWSFAPPGMPPILSFQPIPDELLPGASCFVITYHPTPDPEVCSIQPAANTTYAVEGLTFVSTTPEATAVRWQTLLNPATPVYPEKNGYTVTIPPHTAWWMTPQVFQERYALEWTPSPHRYGDVAAVHLLAENLNGAASRLGTSATQQVNSVSQEPILVISSAKDDGVTFIIRQYPIDKWRTERSSITGEKIVLL